MSLSINTNVAALTAHRNMVANDNNMTTSLTRLSTGLRINSASDDASGLTIADSLAAQADGLGQGIRNANDGVSIVQTADGALEESVNIVNTIKTKAIQAASDTQTTSTRSAIQEDIDKLMKELDSIATTTSYNGMQLLNGTYTNKVIQTGASANETSSISIGDTESDSIGHISTATLNLADQDGGDVQLTINSSITGEDVALEKLTIKANNREENGLGALADEINTMSSVTGVSATAVVESTTQLAIQEGTTGSDFAINGVTIGAINTINNDADAALVTAINDKTSETGISAASNDDGTMTLTSEDGRVISITGDLKGVFGKDVTGDDLSTIGHITLTQEGSSQFNISGSGISGIGRAMTTSDSSAYTNSENVTLAEGSTIKENSTLARGTVIGADMQVSNSKVEDTLHDYELKSGSSLKADSIIAQGTVLSGNAEVGGTVDETVESAMLVAKGSTLEAGTVLAAGTVVTNTFKDDSNNTIEAGTILSTDTNIGSDLTLTEDMTIAAGSSLDTGSTLYAGSTLGTDLTLQADLTLTNDMTLEAGSSIETGSVLAEGSTLGDDTIVQANGGGNISTTSETRLAEGSTLGTGSTIGKGSDLGSTAITLGDNSELATGESLILEAGSTLTSNTVLAAGTVVNQNMTLEDTDGNNVTIEAGTTITEALTLGADIVLTDSLTLEQGSDIETGSEVIFSSETKDSVIKLSDQESLTLADISVMTQEDAQIAITIAEAALADLDSTRSSLGSVENQLTSTISNLSVTKTNVTASESTIRDVDFAEETSNYARLSLLAQTSSYALSQANASSSNITSLLQ
ncbi:MAG: flagellin [Desulfobacter postgatei]|uniref:Flagellin n=1 Tax=Desulfobacter postgatei TaxID=2293 RepID=A0A2G6MQM4_9BACT|nr:MAG: flagellin [Desulfobacter postgatei]